jgi:hypothetical protein
MLDCSDTQIVYGSSAFKSISTGGSWKDWADDGDECVGTIVILEPACSKFCGWPPHGRPVGGEHLQGAKRN